MVAWVMYVRNAGNARGVPTPVPTSEFGRRLVTTNRTRRCAWLAHVQLRGRQTRLAETLVRGRRTGPDGLPLGWRAAPAARQAQLAASTAIADHGADGLREVRAASRWERIPPVPVENEEQVPVRRVPVHPGET
jgi:hypothetical protein